MDKATKKQTIEAFRINENDCGSTPVQIALLTVRIKEITEHMKVHKKDFSTKRGLLALVNQRRNLLNYLERTDYPKFKEVIAKLGLRK